MVEVRGETHMLRICLTRRPKCSAFRYPPRTTRLKTVINRFINGSCPLGFNSLQNKKEKEHFAVLFSFFLALTPNFNTMISSGAFTLKEKFHGETFLFSIKKVI